MTYPGGNGGPIPNYDNYGQPVSPTVGGEGSAPILPAPPPGGGMGTGRFGQPPAFHGYPQGGNGVAPNGQPMPAGDFPGNVQGQDLGVPPGQILYEDGSSGPPPTTSATPTTAAADAMGFPQNQQSAWALALQQRMANGGVGDPMSFYNFVHNRGIEPTPDASAPPAMMMQAQPRPLVIGPTNTTPAQIIPQQAPQGPGGMAPIQQPAAPQISQPNAPVNVRPNVPNPGTMGFFPAGKGLYR